MKIMQVQTLLYGCLIFGGLFLSVASAPQPNDISATLRQGSGKFIVLACVVPADCSDTTFLVTALPAKGQLFRAKGVPTQPESTFERSDLIQVTGARLSNRILYYLPFHEVFNAALDGNMLESDSFTYKADIGSSEARCLIEILRQQILPIGGGSGYSLLFDGIDDVIVTPVDAWFPKDAFTVMLWIRVYDRTKQATIFSFFGDKKPVFEISNPLNLTCIVGFLPLSPSNIDVTDGKWHHIAATWSSSSMTCTIVVDALISAVAVASGSIPKLESSGTIILGNRQACDILDSSEHRALDTKLKASKSIYVTPEEENDAFTFVTKPSALLTQHLINRAHGIAAPGVSFGDSSPLHGDPYINSRQRSDYALCRCTGGCFHPSLAFGGEMDDVRLYSFEKTIPELRVESKFVFIQENFESQQLNKTRPQLDQQFFGLQLWMSFDIINGSLIADSSGKNRSSYLGSIATQRYPCHRKREPFRVVSSTGVLGGYASFKSIGASSRIEVRLPGIFGIGVNNESLIPRFRFNKKLGAGQFYHAACGYSGNLASSMLVQSNSLVGLTGCIIYVPNQASLIVDVINYSVSNVPFPTEQGTDPAYVELSYSMSFFRESSVIPSNYLVGLQSDKVSVVKLMMTRPDLSRLNVAIHGLPKYANVWIAIEARCEDVLQCQIPINTMSWETSGTSFIDSSSFSKFSHWKYVHPPFASNLHQTGPQICDTDTYFTPEPLLPSKVCKIGKYYMNDTIFNRPNQGDPLFLDSSKWNWAMLELTDFSRLPYGGMDNKSTLQGVVVECLIHDRSYDVPLDNCTCCYISNCFPPYGRVLEQSALPTTPAAVLRAVLQQNINKLNSLLSIGAPFDRSAINAAAALGNVDILTKLFGQITVRWDYDAIELASNMGFTAAADYLKSRTAMQGYQGKRTGAKCLVRGDHAESFTGFVTTVPYFLASAMRGALGSIGSLTIRWSKAQLTDVSPNFPVSRLQNISFLGLLSLAPRPDGMQVVKSAMFSGFQNNPLVINTSTSTADISQHSCLRTLIEQYAEHGSIYNMDDSFDFDRCKNVTESSSVTNYISCREFGMGVYFFNMGSNTSTFLNTPPRPIVHPSRIVNPVFEPVSGVKVRKNQELIRQSPLGILNASSDNVTGPRFGKDGGREDLVLLQNFSWDNKLDYGDIGSPNNSSFQSTCGTLGLESVAFRFSTKVFPSDFSFVAVIESSSKVRISAKAPPKRSQTRNFVQGDTPSSRLVSKRVLRNVSAFEFEIQGTRFMKPEVESLLSWQYVTTDADGSWVNLWEGAAADLVVKDEPMRHKATFCNDASFSWLETDTILLQVCGLKNLGPGFSDPGLQLAGVGNAILSGTRGGSPRGLVQSLKSKLAYMPNKLHAGVDSFTLLIKDWSNGMTSNAERISLSTVKRPSLVAAGHIETVVPSNYSFIITLTGFAFDQPLDSFALKSIPSKLILRQFDGTSLLGSSITSNATNATIQPALATNLLISDSEHRLQIEVPDSAAGFFYDSFEYSVGVLGSNVTDVAKIIVHVLCRSAAYYNSSLQRCLPCPPGTFNTKMALSSSCETCPPGTQSQSGSTECTPCPVGFFAPLGSLCSMCLPGTYSPKPGLEICIDCPKGNFSSVLAATSCSECGNLAFADESRSSFCKSCPKLTSSNSKTSMSVSECSCVEGSYEPKGETGKECLPCPDGGYCHGNRHPPVTRQHFWTSYTEWSSIEEPHFFVCDHRGVRNVCRGYPEFNRVELTARCAHRGVPGICDYYPFIPTSIFGNTSAIDDRACSTGYTGRVCSSCSVGFYNYPGGSCVQCPSAISVLLISAVVMLFFIFIAAASASPVISVYISASNFQILVLLSRFGIPHPPALAEIWSVLAIFNTNFELIPFQCIMGTAFDWATVWNFEVITLSLILAICIGRWLIPYFLYRPLLNNQASRSLKQHRPASAIPVNRHGSYRPSRPSTPSSQQSDKIDKVPFKVANATNLVIVDVTDGAPSIDAGVFEDDAESTNFDSLNLANFEAQNNHVRKNPDIEKAKMARTGLVSAHSAMSSVASSVDLEQWHGLSHDELEFYLDSAIWIACFVLEYFFFFGSLSTFQVFACRFWKSNTSVLIANPNIVCGDSIHSSLVGISIPMFFVNVALLPCGTLAVLVYGAKRNLIQNPKFMQRWGFFFERFEQEYYWWQMVVIFRKFFLVLIATFLFSDPYLQLTLSCIVLSINVVLNLAARPFREEQHGTLDSFLMLLTILSFSLTLANPTDIVELNNLDASRETGILCAQLVLIGLFFACCVRYIDAELRHTEYDLPVWIMRIKVSVWDKAVQKSSDVRKFIQENISKRMDAKRIVVAESNIVRLSRIRSAVRKDVERAHLKNVQKDSAKEIKLTDWNRHLTDADVEIRKWDSGDVLTEKVSWRTSKFDMRKRIFVLERLLREEALHDSKSPEILNLEREITTALKITLQALKTENEVTYESLYDTEAECEALEQEKAALESRLAIKERKLSETSEKNAFLTTRSNLQVMGLSDESEWKEKLKLEEGLRKQLEETLLRLQLKMSKYNSDL